jgi:hypothetical protein
MIREDSSLYIAPNFEKCFMIPRGSMPQIESNKINSFLKLHGIDKKIVHRNTNELKPTQSQFNTEKVQSMNDDGKALPILISNDDYVLDGHHRWLANHYSNTQQPTIKLPWDASMSLKYMNEYKHTFSKELHEDGAAAVAIGGEPPAMDNTVVNIKKKKTFLQWRNNENK